MLGCSDGEEVDRYGRQVTPVIVSAPPGVKVTLIAGGRDLDDIRSEGPIDNGTHWLSPGRRMLQADDGLRRWTYPVTTTGYRQGPDADGALVISLRRLPVEHLPDIPGMTFAPVPSGSFLFGDRRRPLEPHHVWLTTFFMSVAEVRNEEFRRFLSSPDGWANGEMWTASGLAWRGDRRSSSSATFVAGHPEHQRFGRDELPVTGVTWFEAVAFARWMTKTHGGGMWDLALPDEAEWEKAARGPDDLSYVLSETISDRELSWFNWKKNPGVAVTVVPATDIDTTYRPNRYGLVHMAGNVTEWTRSRSMPYSRARPFSQERRNDLEGTDQRVARGGSWYSASVALLQVAYRETFPPEHSTHELGFRLRAVRMPGPVR